MAKITISKGEEFRPGSTGVSPIGQVGQVFRGQEKGLQAVTDVTVNIAEDVIRKRQKAIDLDYVTNSTVKANEEVRKLKERMLNEIEDPKDFSNKFMTEANKVYNRFEEDAPSEAARNSLKASNAGQRTSQFNNAFNIENKLIADNILSNSIENVNLLGNNLIDNPFEYAVAKKQFNESLDAAKEVLDPIAFKNLEEQGKDILIDSRIRGLMDKNLAEAERLVNSDELKGELEPTDILKYRSAVEAKKEELEREFITKANEKKEAVQLDREIGIFNNQVTQLDLDNDLDQSLYGKEEHLALSKQLRDSLAKEDKKTLAIQRVEVRRGEGIPFDTSLKRVRSDLDIYFDEIVNPTVTSENYESVIKAFTDRYNYVPSTVKSDLLASLHNGDNSKVVQAANTLTNMLKDNPQLVKQFSGSKDLVRSRVVTDSIRAGMTPEEAVKVGDNMLVETNTTEYKQREADFTDNRNPFKPSKLRSFLVDDPDTVPPKMVADFEALYANYAIDFKMSLEAAEDHAYDILKSQWKTTEVNGELEYMKYAPEIYYKKSSKQIRAILDKDIKQHFPEAQGASLAPIVETVDSERPEYMLIYPTDNGVPIPLLDKKGNIVRWRPE